ncbi:rRNA small subunit methyltransferase G-domain-containing protein [Pelagophyceae sp. CCMP2097]|nr:rRNA small subunit methyltransferase G-domain-containing protein [Pelagophyceae sp. CCMP2097]
MTRRRRQRATGPRRFLDHHRARISGVDGPTWDRLEVAAKCLYDWNGKINVVSRKNLDAQTLIEKHYMPSLALLNVPGLRERLDAGAAVMDVGTGGGFPGLPLAIACPNSKFTLVDSVRKKITVVQACADAAFCRNVDALHKRVPEDFKTERFDLVLGRAVTALPSFIDQVAPVLRRASNPVSGAKLSDDELKFPNGVVYLKGGDFDDELQELNLSPREEWAIEALLGGGYEDVLGGGDKRVIHLSAKDVLTAMRR